MIKVITYGTYDLLHYGHIRLLERAKSLGDYLIVGITSDDYDKTRGKINIQQSLMERVEAVRQTGIADEIVIEEYEGQKIDDIKRLGVDIFTVGSDWVGYFDYLKEYCDVVYLPRTEGVSSSELRAEKRRVRIGFVGEPAFIGKFIRECRYVNGLLPMAICTKNVSLVEEVKYQGLQIVDNYEDILDKVDAVYISSLPELHYEQIKQAINLGKHVLCESPIALSKEQCRELFALAEANKVILMDSLKTAYSTAYARLLLQIKSGKIGDVYAVDATCTCLRDIEEDEWNSICAWGPTAMLPIFNLLGNDYKNLQICSYMKEKGKDLFSQLNFVYPHAVANVKVGKGVKSEGELIVSGTKGYAYVPAPWWKTDYFELRYENLADNRRFFYQLDGEGIRYELVAFLKAIENGKTASYIGQDVSEAICGVVERFAKEDVVAL